VDVKAENESLFMDEHMNRKHNTKTHNLTFSTMPWQTARYRLRATNKVQLDT